MQTEYYFLDVSKYRDEQAFSEAYGSLSRWRREKIVRLKRPESRLLSLGAGLLADKMMRDHGMDPDTAEISFTDNERPYIAGCRDLHFNLSHSGCFAMGVVSEHEIGCDIQITNEKRLSAAPRLFSPEEGQIYDDLDQNGRAAYFYRTWVLKESLIKADGRGLTFPMKSVSVMPSAERCAEEIIFEGKRYLLKEVPAPEGYRAAYCEMI